MLITLQALRAINAGACVSVFGIQESPLAYHHIDVLPARTGGCLYFYSPSTMEQLPSDMYGRNTPGQDRRKKTSVCLD